MYDLTSLAVDIAPLRTRENVTLIFGGRVERTGTLIHNPVKHSLELIPNGQRTHRRLSRDASRWHLPLRHENTIYLATHSEFAGIAEQLQRAGLITIDHEVVVSTSVVGNCRLIAARATL